MSFSNIKPGIPLLIVIALASAGADDDLPKREPGELIELEPKLMLAPDWESRAPTNANAHAASETMARLEAELSRAIRSAASGERLFKSGVIAKVDAESRALKVIRLTAELEAARRAAAEAEREVQRKRFEANEVPKDALDKAEAAAAEAATAAADAAATWERAELEAAELNLHRRKQLLRAGIGTKAQVQRAEEQVSAIKRKSTAAHADKTR